MSTFNSFPSLAKWIIGILVVLNMFCLAALWLGHPSRHPPHQRLPHKIKKQLELTDAQMPAFNQLFQKQKQEHQAIEKEINRFCSWEKNSIKEKYCTTSIT